MKISRADLFNRVWTTPMTKLAKEFDISDVGLSKICRKHRIPTPPPGYWAKVAYGKVAKGPGLPAGEDEVVTIDARPHRAPIQPEEVTSDEFADLTVAVAAATDALAPTTKATFAVLSNAEPSEHGFVVCGSSAVIACSLSAGTIQRAALVLDAIERALPAVGGRMVHDREKRKVMVAIGGEHIGLGIAEETKRTETVIKNPKYAFLNERVYHYHFTGNLRLTVDADYSGRKSWSDGSRARLEDKLSSFVVGLVAASRAVVRLRAEREVQRLKWEAESKRHAEAMEVQRKREAFAEQLVKEAAAWRRFREVEGYVAHLNERAASDIDVLPPSSRDWLDLAVQLSQELDPLAKRLTILRDQPDVPSWYGPFGKPIVS